MNKFVSVFFAAALALALNACGDNGKAAADAKAAADKATAAAKEASDKAAAAAKDAGNAAMQAGKDATDAAKAAGTAAMDSMKAPAATPPASTMTPAHAPARWRRISRSPTARRNNLRFSSNQKAGLRRLFLIRTRVALQRRCRKRQSGAPIRRATSRYLLDHARRDRGGSDPCRASPGSRDPRAGSRRA